MAHHADRQIDSYHNCLLQACAGSAGAVLADRRAIGRRDAAHDAALPALPAWRLIGARRSRFGRIARAVPRDMQGARREWATFSKTVSTCSCKICRRGWKGSLRSHAGRAHADRRGSRPPSATCRYSGNPRYPSSFSRAACSSSQGSVFPGNDGDQLRDFACFRRKPAARAQHGVPYG